MHMAHGRRRRRARRRRMGTDAMCSLLDTRLGTCTGIYYDLHNLCDIAKCIYNFLTWCSRLEANSAMEWNSRGKNDPNKAGDIEEDTKFCYFPLYNIRAFIFLLCKE